MLQCLGSFFFQSKFILNFVQGSSDENKSTGPVINLIYMLMNLCVMILIIISFCKENRLNLVHLQVLILLMRTLLSILDFEGKRFDEEVTTNMLIILLCWTITILGVCFNFISSKMIIIYAVALISSFLSVLGTFIMEKKLEGSSKEIFS